MGCGWVIDGKADGYDAGTGTSNEAEYLACIAVLKRVKEIAQIGDDVAISGDSRLVINQVTDKYACRSEHLRPLLRRAQSLIDDLRAAGVAVSITWRPR